MKNLKLWLGAGGAAAGLAFAGAALADTPPAPTPMAQPAMGMTLSANPHPATFDAGPLGPITVDGVISGLAAYDSAPVPGQHDSFFDVTNAQVIINKSTGPVQFYLQAGAYSFPTVGVPYSSSGVTDPATFGYLPQGFAKLVPNEHLSFEIGALPTLIGAELGFTFQNPNIQRGLLWNVEPLVSKGLQANYAQGPWSGSLAVTDGYYTDDYTNISGLLSYTFKNADVLTFAAEGNAGRSTAGSAANGQIYNLIYTHTQGPLTVTPYLQYMTTPNIPGYSASGDSWGGAVLAKYSFTPEWSLAGRVEYETSSGPANLIGYGVGSDAWSFTVTPTFQRGIFFARAEFSYVGLSGYAPGGGFGRFGSDGAQYRVLAESGLVF